jgi:polyisoprenoid-binding protein YceI
MKRSARIALVVLLFMTAGAAFAATETYSFDKYHSLIGFRIRHVVSKVEGRFKTFDGTITLDRGNPAASKVELTIQAASVDTAVEQRDNDLRSPNYFDVEKYPTITFRSTKVQPKGNDQYEVTGEFSMHGVTKTIQVPVKYLGAGKMGKTEKAGFEVSLPLKREDYGIGKENPILGDEVEINIQVEANKQAPEEGKPAAAPAKS